MALKVIVDNSNDSVRVREGEKNGRKWRMVSQRVWIARDGSPFPERMEITLPDGVQPYAPGNYLLDLNKHVVRGQYDSLSLSRDGITLDPVPKTA